MSPTAGPKALASLARRQARLPMHREAANWIDASAASVACRSPRTPHAKKLPPGRGETARAGGHQHSFLLFREPGRAAKALNSWMRTIWGGALSGSTKRRTAFAIPLDPRKCSISPRNQMFLPRLNISALPPFSLSISLFSRERKEGKRGGNGGAMRSTGCICKSGIQNLRVVEKVALPREFRGRRAAHLINDFNDLAHLRVRIHGFSGEMPPSPPAIGHSGGAHGPI